MVRFGVQTFTMIVFQAMLNECQKQVYRKTKQRLHVHLNKTGSYNISLSPLHLF